jgi:hypothetical protein
MDFATIDSNADRGQNTQPSSAPFHGGDDDANRSSDHDFLTDAPRQHQHWLPPQESAGR